MIKDKVYQTVHKVLVTTVDVGSRLDSFLASKLHGISRNRIQSLIASGCVSDHSRIFWDSKYRVKSGVLFQISIPEAIEPIPAAQKMDLNIAHEDKDIVVVDKPAGLVVHPAPGNQDQTLVNALLDHCGNSLSGIGGIRRPGIVHRLDKETSGLLVVAKNDNAHTMLAEQFSAHKVKRSYVALVWGVPQNKSNTIETNVGRHSIHRKKMTVVKAPKGKKAVTKYKVTKTFGLIAAEVECRLMTGRTHQLRVHLSHHGHPIIGDNVYGTQNRYRQLLRKNHSKSETLIGRQALHAKTLGFIHPTTGQKVSFSSKIPNDINILRNFLENI